jgi:hypothetical protein
LAVLLCAGLLLGGCGSTHLLAGQTTSAAPSGEAVIRDWSNTLRRGDVAGAARYFALPSIFANGTGTGIGGLAVVTIHTESEAVTVNSELTCGSVLLSAKRVGKYLNALFRLTNRSGPGADCDGGAGELARVDFLIADGHIVEWVRAPEAPTGGTAPEPTVPVPTSPTPPDSV